MPERPTSLPAPPDLSGTAWGLICAASDVILTGDDISADALAPLISTWPRPSSWPRDTAFLPRTSLPNLRASEDEGSRPQSLVSPRLTIGEVKPVEKATLSPWDMWYYYGKMPWKLVLCIVMVVLVTISTMDFSHTYDPLYNCNRETLVKAFFPEKTPISTYAELDAEGNAVAW